MKNILFTFLFLLLFNFISFSQQISSISSRVSNNKIVLEFDLDRYDDCSTSEVTAYWSSDGGENYEKLCCAQGDIGKNVPNGINKKITWNVMEYTNNKSFKESNVIFYVKWACGITKTLSYTDDLYSKAKSFDIPGKQVELDGRW